MRNYLKLIMAVVMTLSVNVAWGTKIQQQSIVSPSDCTSRGESNSACLPLDTQIYVTASGINNTLNSAIATGQIGGSSSGGLNLISNPDFEQGVTTNWSVTAGTLAAVTSGANLLLGATTASFLASASGQYLNSTAQAVPVALQGGQCLASIYYKYAGSTGDYTFQVDNGSGTIIQSLSIPASSSATQLFLPLFSCGTGNVRIQILSNVASPSTIYVDHVYVGQVNYGTHQGVSQSSPSFFPNISVPYNQLTQTSNSTAKIETGYNNLLVNPNFENSTPAAGWTIGGASAAAASTYHEGKQAVALTVSLAGSFTQDVTPTQSLSGTNMEAGAWVNTTMTTVTVCARVGGVTLTGSFCNTVPSTGVWTYVSANFVGPASGSVGVAVVWTGTSGTINVDESYVGEARNLNLVSQAQFMGSIVVSGCSASWSTTSTTYAAFSPASGCTYTTSGSAIAPSTNVPGIKFASLAPGNYLLQYEGALGHSGNNYVYYQFSDGTNTSQEQSNMGDNATTSITWNGFTHNISYNTAQTNVTLQIYAKVNSGSGSITGTNANPGVIKVYYFPTQSQAAISAAINTKWNNAGAVTIGATTTAPTKGTVSQDNFWWRRNGTNMDFRYEYVQTAAGANGSGDYLFTIPTATGCTIDTTALTANSSAINYNLTGAIGSGSILGLTSAGSPSTAIVYNSTQFRLTEGPNTAATSSFIYVGSGSSNGLGAAQQSYAISGSVPCAGWGAVTAPILVGSVTSNSAGALHTEYVSVTSSCTSSPCTIASESSSWLTNITRNSTGNYNLVIPAGQFSAAPICICNTLTESINAITCDFSSTSTSTSVSFATFLTATGAVTDANFNLICMGAR